MPHDTNATDAPRLRVAMVCTGNICRSPLAEALLRGHLEHLGVGDRVEVRSFGTAPWHAGRGADPRTSAEATRRGVDLSAHRAAHFTAEALTAFDHVFVMDKHNLFDVLALDPDEAHSHKVRLAREFDPEPGDFSVPDPYAGGPEGFARVHDLLDRTTARIAEELVRQHGLSST
jgi:protein-tyrosine phosphatase